MAFGLENLRAMKKLPEKLGKSQKGLPNILLVWKLAPHQD
jgi:hypothetical protein